GTTSAATGRPTRACASTTFCSTRNWRRACRPAASTSGCAASPAHATTRRPGLRWVRLRRRKRAVARVAFEVNGGGKQERACARSRVAPGPSPLDPRPLGLEPLAELRAAHADRLRVERAEHAASPLRDVVDRGPGVAEHVILE